MSVARVAVSLVVQHRMEAWFEDDLRAHRTIAAHYGCDLLEVDPATATKEAVRNFFHANAAYLRAADVVLVLISSHGNAHGTVLANAAGTTKEVVSLETFFLPLIRLCTATASQKYVVVDTCRVFADAEQQQGWFKQEIVPFTLNNYYITCATSVGTAAYARKFHVALCAALASAAGSEDFSVTVQRARAHPAVADCQKPHDHHSSIVDAQRLYTCGLRATYTCNACQRQVHTTLCAGIDHRVAEDCPPCMACGRGAVTTYVDCAYLHAAGSTLRLQYAQSNSDAGIQRCRTTRDVRHSVATLQGEVPADLRFLIVRQQLDGAAVALWRHPTTAVHLVFACPATPAHRFRVLADFSGADRRSRPNEVAPTCVHCDRICELQDCQVQLAAGHRLGYRLGTLDASCGSVAATLGPHHIAQFHYLELIAP
jgi:hypothetical protein